VSVALPYLCCFFRTLEDLVGFEKVGEAAVEAAVEEEMIKVGAEAEAEAVAVAVVAVHVK